MNSNDIIQRPVRLALPVATGATAAQISAELLRLWQAIDAALSPVIGKGGAAALYRRSLLIAAREHPWLSAAGSSADAEMLALHVLFTGQDSDTTAAAANAFLQALYELLVLLVGPSLVGRLLGAAWDAPSDSPPAQETRS